jgi:hypothetical protein
MKETKLKKFMDDNMIDVKKLAKIMHMQPSAIYNYRTHGIKNVARAYAFAYVLKCDHNDLLERTKVSLQDDD